MHVYVYYIESNGNWSLKRVRENGMESHRGRRGMRSLLVLSWLGWLVRVLFWRNPCSVGQTSRQTDRPTYVPLNAEKKSSGFLSKRSKVIGETYGMSIPSSSLCLCLPFLSFPLMSLVPLSIECLWLASLKNGILKLVFDSFSFSLSDGWVHQS